MRPTSAAASILLLASCLNTAPPSPPTPRPAFSVSPPTAGAAPECPPPREPSYLPWGLIGFTTVRGRVSSIRSDAGLSSFVLERRSDLAGAPTSVTAPPYVIYGRSTYLLWSGTLGASELSAWWEEGTGDCRIYHARLALAGDPVAVESHLAKIIASIPAAFVDASAGKTGLLAEIPLEHVPSSVAVMPFQDRLFVVDRDGGLSAFAMSTNALIRRTALPMTDPHVRAVMAVVPFSKRVYIADFVGDRVLVVDGTTLDLVATVAVGRGPTAIAADPKANRVYVTSLGHQSARASETTPGSVTVIDGRTDTVVATVPTKGHPLAIDVVGETGRAYVAALAIGPLESSFIQVIDTHAGTEVATIGVSAADKLLADPVAGVVYAMSRYVVTAPTGAEAIGAKWIELNAGTNEVWTFADGPGDVRAMGWHGGNDDRYRRVYVASQSEVGGVLGIYRHLDPRYTRLSWNGEIRVGSEPVSIAVDSATHRVYVASAGAKLVSVILQGPG